MLTDALRGKSKVQFPNKMPPAHTIKQLQITLAYNKTDATFGWAGFTNALRLYYTSNDETTVQRQHSYPLVEGLSPSVSYTLVETKLLGKPYTDCEPKEDYTQQACQQQYFMEKVLEICDCYPEYVHPYLDFIFRLLLVTQMNFYVTMIQSRATISLIQRALLHSKIALTM